MTDPALNIGIITESPEETSAIAALLAEYCTSGDCVLLRGDLGAGKTQFARGLIRASCNIQEEVVSPTFTLVQTYPATCGVLWHFDLYRLENPHDVYETGIEEALREGITLIEWPELITNMLPKSALDVHIGYEKNDNQRVITFTGHTAQWRPYFDRLKEYDRAA